MERPERKKKGAKERGWEGRRGLPIEICGYATDPDTSLHCEVTTDTRLVHRAVCLFTSQYTHCTYPQRDG